MLGLVSEYIRQYIYINCKRSSTHTLVYVAHSIAFVHAVVRIMIEEQENDVMYVCVIARAISHLTASANEWKSANFDRRCLF